MSKFDGKTEIIQDVTKFHSDLRRMVLTDFGGPTGPGGQPVGLDLVGDGKARLATRYSFVEDDS